MNYSVNSCPCPRNLKTLDLIVSITSKWNIKKVGNNISEELFQFSEAYIMESKTEEAHKSSQDQTSDEEEVSDGDDIALEIQHNISEKQNSHFDSTKELLRF